MAVRNTDTEVTLTIDERIVVAARRNQRAAAAASVRGPSLGTRRPWP
jgi:hypothetical protein